MACIWNLFQIFFSWGVGIPNHTGNSVGISSGWFHAAGWLGGFKMSLPNLLPNLSSQFGLSGFWNSSYVYLFIECYLFVNNVPAGCHCADIICQLITLAGLEFSFYSFIPLFHCLILVYNMVLDFKFLQLFVLGNLFRFPNHPLVIHYCVLLFVQKIPYGFTTKLFAFQKWCPP